MPMRLCLLTLLLAGPSVLAQDMPLSQIIEDGETWKQIDGKFEPIGGFAWDNTENRLVLFDLQGKLTGYLDQSMKLIPGKAESVLDQHSVSVRGKKYSIAHGKLMVDGEAVRIPVKEPIDIEVWHDGGTIVVSDAADKYLWAFRLEKDGSIGPGDRYYSLYVRRGDTRSEAGEMVMDNMRRLYVGTKEGVQVFDPIGRLCGVLTKPCKERVTAIEFGGEKGDLLFVACGKELFVRKMLAQARYIQLPMPKKK